MKCMELLLSLCVGLGLSAACGFRIFVPLFAIGLASHTGHLSLAPSFAWMSSREAVIAFGVATFLEVGAYYIPWLDHLLDTVATPVAVIAGSMLTAAMVADLSPFLRWSLGIMAGGSVAALVQSGTVLARAASLTTTGGLGNPIVATAELAGSVVATITALMLPVLAMALVIGLVTLCAWKWIVPDSRMAASPK